MNELLSFQAANESAIELYSKCGTSENRLHCVELSPELCQSLWPHKRIPECFQTLGQKNILIQRHMLLQQSI